MIEYIYGIGNSVRLMRCIGRYGFMRVDLLNGLLGIRIVDKTSRGCFDTI